MTVFALKIIAAVTMLVDHFGAAVFSHLVETTSQMAAYEMLRNVGRIAFPIYAYLVAQGCLHTKSISRYMLRLMLLAIISEVIFDIAFYTQVGGISFLHNTNIFFTLLLGVAAIALYEQAKRRLPDAAWSIFVAPIAAIPPMLAAWLLSSDYGHIGVLLIFVIYIAKPQNRNMRTVTMALALCLIYFPLLLTTHGYTLNIHYMFSLVAVLCVFAYNGKPGKNNAAIKWGFYFFYPAHLVVLIAVRVVICRAT